jgi:NAD(P)-dependent dehydrogenase (short-subunit alcohol dehydrogenase family)
VDGSEGEGYREYAASKRELADSLAVHAREWAPRVRVNGVAPGPALAPERQREAAGRVLLAERPTAEAVAHAVAFLAENEAITGQILYVDGGQHLMRRMF